MGDDTLLGRGTASNSYGRHGSGMLPEQNSDLRLLAHSPQGRNRAGAFIRRVGRRSTVVATGGERRTARSADVGTAEGDALRAMSFSLATTLPSTSR